MEVMAPYRMKMRRKRILQVMLLLARVDFSRKLRGAALASWFGNG
jgi:hypothetical protein